MNKRTIVRAAYIVLFWTIIALLFGGQNYLNYALKGVACHFWGTLFEHIPTFAIWAIFTPLIIKILTRFPLVSSKNIWIDLAVHAGTSTILGIISLLIIGTGRWLYYQPAQQTFLEYMKRFALVWFSYQYFMYTAMILFLLTINYYKKFRNQEAEAIKLQKLLVESQLKSLKMQLHPHFLFNTLNTISMLVRMDKKNSANQVISRLGDMLRQVLILRNDQLVSLEQEIQLTEKYLSIEAIRFEERLTYKIDLDENTHRLQIPDMLLQPVVENSIKHGMKFLEGPMHIEIKTFLEKDRFYITVKDNGKGFDTSDEKFINNGIGLKNTIERCEKIFTDSVIEINSQPAKGTVILFSFPKVENKNE